MIGRAARIWTVLAVGSVLGAAEPSAAGPGRDNHSTGFRDITTAAEAADAASGAGGTSGSFFDNPNRSTTEGPNWLLDEMTRDTYAAPASIDELLREVREGRRDAPSRAASEPKTAARAPNPFAKYLASWLTPEDYALLQVHEPESSALLPAGRGSAEDVSRSPLRTRDAARENPFVAAEKAAREQREQAGDRTGHTAQTAQPSSHPQSPPALSPAPATAVAPAPGASDPAPAPSRWEPATNEDKKYFPQLNRF